MVEMVDTRDLGSRAEMRWGSSPHTRTILFASFYEGRDRKTSRKRGYRIIGYWEAAHVNTSCLTIALPLSNGENI